LPTKPKLQLMEPDVLSNVGTVEIGAVSTTVELSPAEAKLDAGEVTPASTPAQREIAPMVTIPESNLDILNLVRRVPSIFFEAPFILDPPSGPVWVMGWVWVVGLRVEVVSGGCLF
jgi:hypothetical protein